MADRIKKGGEAVATDDTTRQKASQQEHSKATAPTSFRLPPETLAQLEALRIAQAQQTGRVPTATEVIKALIAAAHKRINK